MFAHIYHLHTKKYYVWETWTNLSLTEGNLAFYMMVFSIESIEKLNHREHGDALKKNARQHITTDLSDFIGVRRPFEHNHSVSDDVCAHLEINICTHFKFNLNLFHL
jgi:hypothetical protein